MFDVLEVAKTVHAVTRAYSYAIGQAELPPEWEHLPNKEKALSKNLIAEAISHLICTPQELHETWVKEKCERGWIHGLERDYDNKKHPCLVEWAELPEEEKIRDQMIVTLIWELCE